MAIADIIFKTVFVSQFNHIVDMFLLFIFFMGVKNKGTRLKLLLFPLVIFCYAFSFSLWRFTVYINFVHLLLIGIWVYFYYRPDLGQIFHHTIIYFLTIRVTRMVLLLPSLNSFFLNGIHLFSDADTDKITGNIIISLFKLVAVLLVKRAIPLNVELKNSYHSLSSMLLVVIFIFHRYNALDRYDSEASAGADVTSSLLGIAILLLMILTERFFINQIKEKDFDRIILKSRSQYQEAMDRMQSTNDINRIYHDMRNHLFCISALANDSAKAKEYISHLDNTLSAAVSTTETGDPMLNAILSERIQDAKRSGISMTVDIDFREGYFMSPIDTSAIFCNALDNALEAARQVTEPSKRIIRVKVCAAGNMLLIQVSNNFDQPVIRKGDSFITTKRQDTGIHGLGISSIRHAAEKYGGEVDIQIEDRERFVIRVFIPLPN